ncbi:hypothetical protein GNY06_00705 [Elizabethkingia argentiflava]|uniref:Uncharacterized protein n=1 Tax=Elizabethkingia argenteiflava TaxID=2681556 RepID=A0A845PQ76_9FLAO|nr:hypothetical protein [Elizabethkingia argenteiflava]NAW49974.1 hypothetical protein [Elizabethkingia argenteiflava]
MNKYKKKYKKNINRLNYIKCKFPTDITSYLETHCAISMALAKQIENQKGLAWKIYNQEGTRGIYELAEELTDEFEDMIKYEPWRDKDYLKDIDFFLEIKEMETEYN